MSKPTRITIDPVTRVEGHLKIEAVVEGGVIKEAHSSGTLWRGFEVILKGKDPRDATLLTQRICGVCPIAHATASVLSIESAVRIHDKIPDNGRIIRNLILGSNFIQSHILHFYHLAALDYVDVTSVADFEGNDPALKSLRDFAARGALGPFVPRYEGDYRFDKRTNQMLISHYVEALHARKAAHEMLAIWGGKMPHQCSIVAGGVTVVPTTDKIASFLSRLSSLRDFIDNIYIPDVITISNKYADYFEMGKGCMNFLSYGGYDIDGKNPDYAGRERLLPSGVVLGGKKYVPIDTSKINESVKHSWFEATDSLHPSEGKTIPAYGKQGAYSWVKSPRYGGEALEVGPLARFMVAYTKGHEKVRELVDPVLSEFKAGPDVLISVLGRHATRATELKLITENMAKWVVELKPGEPVFYPHEIPSTSHGMGITEAPRGAVGHWVKIKEGKIDHYQCVVPTTWNAGPRDGKDQPGPMEQALEGTKLRDEKNPYEIVRIIRSFDPCLACAVHVVNPKGTTMDEFVIR